MEDFDAALPILLARGIDRMEVEGVSFGRDTWLLVGAFLLAGVLAWVFNYVRQSRSARVVGDVVLRLRLDVFRAVMRRDMSFFDEHQSGRIVSRATSDTEEFANVVVLSDEFYREISEHPIPADLEAGERVAITIVARDENRPALSAEPRRPATRSGA